MKNTRSFFMVAVLFSVAALLAALPGRLSSQQAAAVRVDADDVGGMVTSAKGPEAGVWVIAETTNYQPSLPRSWLPMIRVVT